MINPWASTTLKYYFLKARRKIIMQKYKIENVGPYPWL